MTTNQIIKQMEKDFDEEFPNLMHFVNDCGNCSYVPYGDDVKGFMKRYTRTLLESFGEEIIGEDEKENRTLKQGIDYDIHKLLDFGLEIARIGGKNNLRAEQRLKMKEIISSIGK